MPLNLRQIEAFRAVMVTGSMVGAAGAMHISQPAVSRLIADLERDLTYPLFTRTRGRLIPTEEGNELYLEVQRSFVGLGQVETAARQLGKNATGVVRIAAMPSLSGEPLTRGVAAFSAENSEASLILDVRPRREVIDLIAARQFDIGVATLPIDDPNIDVRPLAPENSVCAVPAGHRLAAKDVIDARDLEGEPFISFPAATLYRIRVDRVFEELAVNRIMRFEARTAEMTGNLVAEGAGVAVVGAWDVPALWRKEVAIRPFEPAIPLRIGLLTPANRPKARRIELVCDALAESYKEASERRRRADLERQI